MQIPQAYRSLLRLFYGSLPCNMTCRDWPKDKSGRDAIAILFANTGYTYGHLQSIESDPIEVLQFKIKKLF